MNLSDYIIPDTFDLRRVIQKLDKVKNKVLFVTDSNDQYIGSISDGDIRRALILHDPGELNARLLCNKKSAFFDHFGKLQNHRNNVYRLLPVLDENRTVKEIRLDKPLLECDTLVVMAGGLGTRLGPLTEHKPKALVSVDGQTMLDHIISNAASQGVNKFVLCLNHQSEKIVSHIKKYELTKIKIDCVIEDKRLDTAGALSIIPQELLPNSFFVKNCDVFENLSYNNFFKNHKKRNAALSIMSIVNTIQLSFGVIKSNNQRVQSISEKPVMPFYISGGLYIINKNVLKHMAFNEPISMPDLINNIIDKNELVVEYREPISWIDAGTMDDLEKITI